MKLKKTGKWILIITAIIALAIVGFGFWRYNKAEEATITLDGPKTSRVNEEIVIPVSIDTANKTVNAVEVYLKFDPVELEVVSLSKDNSFFSLWIKDQPAFSNESGEISFAGGLPTPGFNGISQIGAIRARPKKSGKIIIKFDQKSRALLNDGIGTEVPLRMDPISIKVGK